MKITLNCVGIVSKPNREKCSRLLDEILNWFFKKKIQTFLDIHTASLLHDGHLKGFSCFSMDNLPELLDLIIVLGGDGTLLRVARQIGKANIPILGANLGGLGFLADNKAEDLLQVLDTIVKGEYLIDERMMLEVSFKKGNNQCIVSTCALNDIVINSAEQSRIVKLCTYVDDIWINTFLSDGLIIATPTGSTAYSLSAGGPIIHPGLHAILVTPICPHILTNRPIVIPDNGTIKVTIQKKDRGNGIKCILSADGQVLATLGPDNTVMVSKAPHTIKLVQPKGNDYYKVLRTKLKWGERG